MEAVGSPYSTAVLLSTPTAEPAWGPAWFDECEGLNRHPEIQRGKLRRLQAEQLFDGVLVGGEEIAAGAAEKPAASIFLKACSLAGCQPCEVAA